MPNAMERMILSNLQSLREERAIGNPKKICSFIKSSPGHLPAIILLYQFDHRLKHALSRVHFRMLVNDAE